MLTSKTFRPVNLYNNKWYIFDAKDQTVGRMATKIANVLTGKNHPSFAKDVDPGTGVIIINASQVSFSGKKLDQKIYYKHTGYVGGLKKRTARKQMEIDPSVVVMKAVKGMLPNNRLGRKQLTRLRVFNGAEHTHKAQNPTSLDNK